MNKQEITNRISQLPEEYRTFILSGFIQDLITVYAETHRLDEEQKLVLEDGFTLYLLFFLTEDGFVQFVSDNQLLDSKAARVLLKGMQLSLPVEIYNLLNKTNQLLESKDTELNTRTTALNDIKNTPNDNSSTATEENVYPSLQTNILNKDASQNNSNTPRWGS